VTDLLGNYFDQFGCFGSGNGLIDQPWGVAVDGDGNIYVAETGNARVQKFDIEYTYSLKSGEGSFSDPGKFDYPMGICVDGADRVYVADGGNNRVQIFSSNGTHIETWDNSDLGFVSDVAYSTTTGNIYVANNNSARTIVPHTTAGDVQQDFGGPGTTNGSFWDDSTNALLLAIDSTGNVYVLETAYNRVQKFSSAGTFVTSWGNPGTDSYATGGLVDPRAITVDGDDNVWVTDPSRSVLIKYDPTGVVLDELEYHPSGAVAADSRGNLWWAGYTGENGDPIVIKMTAGDLSADGLVSFLPHGDDAQTVPWDGFDVAVDSAGNVYVLDFANYLVQKFLPADGVADPPF
jgi:streptogramin lyase